MFMTLKFIFFNLIPKIVNPKKFKQIYALLRYSLIVGILVFPQ